MPEANGRDEIHLRAVIATGLALVCTLAAVAVAAYFAWTSWRSAATPDVPNAPLNFRVAGAALESAPQRDYSAYLAEKQQLLNSYQWMDEKAGIARIPIEQAMRLMVERNDAQPVPRSPR